MTGIRRSGSSFATDTNRCWLAMARRAGLREEDGAGRRAGGSHHRLRGGFRAGKYDRERGRLRCWLQGVAVNKIREARRQIARPEVQLTDSSDATRYLDGIADGPAIARGFDEEWSERCWPNACGGSSSSRPQDLSGVPLIRDQRRQPEDVAAQLGIARETVYVHKSAC